MTGLTSLNHCVLEALERLHLLLLRLLQLDQQFSFHSLQFQSFLLDVGDLILDAVEFLRLLGAYAVLLLLVVVILKHSSLALLLAHSQLPPLIFKFNLDTSVID